MTTNHQEPASNVVLTIETIEWMDGVDERWDYCAHGVATLTIDSEMVLSEECTLSAAALYLLRTLERPLPADVATGNFLFPCCGSAVQDSDGGPVLLLGCANGVDLTLSSLQGPVPTLKIRRDDGQSWIVDSDAWAAAVRTFAGSVCDFYSLAQTKLAANDQDASGFRSFLREWRERYGTPLTTVEISPTSS